MKQILIVRANNKFFKKNKYKDSFAKSISEKFSDYKVIVEFTENDKVFNGFSFVLELVK